jgi:hypothetical protein
VVHLTVKILFAFDKFFLRLSKDHCPLAGEQWRDAQCRSVRRRVSHWEGVLRMALVS